MRSKWVGQPFERTRELACKTTGSSQLSRAVRCVAPAVTVARARARSKRQHAALRVDEERGREAR